MIFTAKLQNCWLNSNCTKSSSAKYAFSYMGIDISATWVNLIQMHYLKSHDAFVIIETCEILV